MRPLVLALLVGLFSGCGGSFKGGEGGEGSGGSSTTSATSSSGTTSSGTTSSGGGGAPTGPDFGACSGPGQCMLAAPGCCGLCGTPELVDFTPINASQQQSFFDATCLDPTGPCPGCASSPNPDLFAYCDGGQCVGADLGTDPLGACGSSSECKLRMGLGCCECGAFGPVTAIAADSEAALQSLLCPPETACPECAPSYPPGAVAECIYGQCAVVYPD